MAQGCRTGPPGYIGWRAGSTTYAIVDYIPLSGTMNFASELSVFGYATFIEHSH
jgi:hypothetical protein